MQKIVWTSISRPMPFTEVLPQPATTLGYYRDIAVLAVPDGEPSPEKVIDITSFMKEDGSLDWDVPAGAWTVYRFGHTSTGKRLRPVPEDLNGLTLEADKMSSEIMSFHMHKILDPIRENLGSYVGSSFTHILFDSYESGDQNWTTKMREEFLKRRGYDMIPWLPVLAGRAIGGKERAARFEWDLKATISELIIENGFSLPCKMIKEAGMESQVEPYGGGFDEIETAGAVDQAMLEFWINRRTTYGGNGLTSAGARASGKTLLAAEAFTGDPSVSEWTETPASLKVPGDSAFAYGINRMVFHSWTHQPFPDNLKPGMCFGWWGTHFGRNQTWFEPGKEWITYLSRCQSLLQRGEQVVDFCVLEKEDPYAPGDAISTRMLINDASVSNGKIVLKSGRSYALLVIPERTTMLPEVALRLKQLVESGAIISGPRPERSPSMQNWPEADNVVRSAGKELWGNADGVSVKENKYGKGRVIWGRPVSEILSEIGLEADVIISGTKNNIRWNHRRDGDNDYYFLTNLNNNPSHFTAKFGISGKIPELWFPETGIITEPGIWKQGKGNIEVDIKLRNNESVFIVFRKQGRRDPVTSITTSVPDSDYTIQRSDKDLLIRSLIPGNFSIEYASGRRQSVKINNIPGSYEINGDWDVTFQGPGAPDHAVTFSRLLSWTESDDSRIKYFSGTAIYRKEFTLEEYPDKNLNLIIDLGNVKELASLKINGKSAGVLWHPPFRTDITKYLQKGSNTLEIAVTNTWANRMIGDEMFPDDCVWGEVTRAGQSLMEFPEWLIKNQPRPSAERTSFATWKYYTKKSPLLRSGLIGPVKIIYEGKVIVKS
jgi:hypothetical protein